jgi:RNA polymerase sigma-70 factor (ECF subfamily)
MGFSVDLGRLYDEHAEALYGFLLNLTRDEEATKEALQEVFAKLAAQPHRLRAVRHERAFLIRMARNALLDSIRRDTARFKYHTQAADDVPLFAATDDPDLVQFRTRLAAALLVLPEEQRAAVHLKLWGGMTFEQIAKALEIPPNTAASRYRYALDKLRSELRPLYDEIR